MVPVVECRGDYFNLDGVIKFAVFDPLLIRGL